MQTRIPCLTLLDTVAGHKTFKNFGHCDKRKSFYKATDESADVPEHLLAMARDCGANSLVKCQDQVLQTFSKVESYFRTTAKVIIVAND